MIENAEYQHQQQQQQQHSAPHHQRHHVGNHQDQRETGMMEAQYLQYADGGISPHRGSYCEGNSGGYETLTTLQPLPPISTVSEKFNGYVQTSVNNPSESFTKFMHQNSSSMSTLGLGLSPYGYKYDNDGINSPINGCFPPLGASAPSAVNSGLGGYSQNQEGALMYSSYPHDSLFSLKSESKLVFHSPHMSSGYEMLPVQHTSSGHQQSSHSVINDMLNGVQHAPSPQSHRPTAASPLESRCVDPSRGQQSETEEINTREVAQKIGSELKRYSIPQAVFAQQVLCRSQGTLSDLLRNPKPWSKLKSGRETFRRMWMWLQEPEFQRMATLRLAGRMTG